MNKTTEFYKIEEINQLESRCRELQAENQELRNKINQLNECLEDVCCGATISCVICNKALPCMCEHTTKVRDTTLAP